MNAQDSKTFFTPSDPVLFGFKGPPQHFSWWPSGQWLRTVTQDMGQISCVSCFSLLM